MAPIKQRLASACRMAKGTPIRPTVIERQLGTRYTVDTLKKLVRRYPKRRFIWIMGADNLLQFHHWRQWRDIARLMPIAVIARPGYDDAARSEEHTSELQSLMRISYDVFCLKKKTTK